MSEPKVHNLSTYANQKCRCAECRAANAEWQAKAKLRRAAALATSGVEHGKDSTYGNHGCRCDDCRRAHAAKKRMLRAEKRIR